jgi:hypothetical protein
MKELARTATSPRWCTWELKLTARLVPLGVMSFAVDPEPAGRLWTLSEQLVF